MLSCITPKNNISAKSNWAKYSSFESGVLDRLLWDQEWSDVRTATNLKEYLKALANRQYFLADSVDKGYEEKYMNLYSQYQDTIDEVLEEEGLHSNDAYVYAIGLSSLFITYSQ